MKTLSTSTPILFLIMVMTSSAFAQMTGEACEFDGLHAHHLANDATFQSQSITYDQTMRDFAAQYGNQYRTEASTNLKTIPVVVHVIHNNGAENISDAQVTEAINQLNEDYRRKVGTPGWGTGGVDTEIQFQLATIDPNGNCTNGILHVQSPNTIHVNNGYGSAGVLALYNTSRWPNTKYLNIYVVGCIVGGATAECPTGPTIETLGYSWQFYTTPGTSSNNDLHDGVVIKHTKMGRTGTAASNTSRILTHEVGHWLNLYHTFYMPCTNNQCDWDGDRICDTPPQTKITNCNTTNTCTTDVNSGPFTTDQNDLKAN